MLIRSSGYDVKTFFCKYAGKNPGIENDLSSIFPEGWSRGFLECNGNAGNGMFMRASLNAWEN